MRIDAAYRPREPQDSPLYGVVAGHLETFLARQRERDRNVPGFVEREFREFLDCFRCCWHQTIEEITRLTTSLAECIRKFLDRRGLGPDSDSEESDPLSRDQPWLSSLYAAAVSGRVAFGPNAGRRVTRTGDQIDPESMDALTSPRCASVSGFSLHANVAVPVGDRQRLERLARYCARPPIAMERLELLADGRLLYRFKRPWRDGTTHVVFEPLEFLEKLAALVPAPKAHLVRYSGVLAPAAKWRAVIVPHAALMKIPPKSSPARGLCLNHHQHRMLKLSPHLRNRTLRANATILGLNW